jgi:hypothetical protein
MRSVAARLQLLLVALVVLLTAAASDRAHYFCNMMDRAMAECCCAGAPDSAAEAGVAVRGTGCCERIVPSTHAVVAASQDAAPGVLATSLISLPPLLEYPTRSFRVLETTPAAARAPPAIGPPLFLAHCSLLI